MLRRGSVGLMICRVLPAPLLRISRVMKTRITLIRVGRPTRLAQTWICSRVSPKWKLSLDCHHGVIQLYVIKTRAMRTRRDINIRLRPFRYRYRIPVSVAVIISGTIKVLNGTQYLRYLILTSSCRYRFPISKADTDIR